MSKFLSRKHSVTFKDNEGYSMTIFSSGFLLTKGILLKLSSTPQFTLLLYLSVAFETATAQLDIFWFVKFNLKGKFNPESRPVVDNQLDKAQN